MSAWVDGSSDTTVCSSISHHMDVILMVGGSVTSTMLCEKATIFLLVPVFLFNDMSRRITPHITQIWRGGPCTMMTRNSSSSRDRDTSIYRRSLTSGVVNVLRRSKISGWTVSDLPSCWEVQNSSNVDRDPSLGADYGTCIRWPCYGALDIWGLRGWSGGGPMFPSSESFAHYSIFASSGVGGVGRTSSFVVSG